MRTQREVKETAKSVEESTKAYERKEEEKRYEEDVETGEGGRL